MAEKKNNSILELMFGDMPEVEAVNKARKAEDLTIKDMFEQRKSALEQQRTDSLRMAGYNALGNALTNLFAPVAWKNSGATAAVREPDNRQYLESFNRAVKATEDLRNVPLMEGEYKLRRAQQDTASAQNMLNSAYSSSLNAQVAANKAAVAHAYKVDEIAAKGAIDMEIAKFKENYRAKHGGTPLNEKALSTALTAYFGYLSTFSSDVGRGAPRSEGKKPMTFSEWIGKNVPGLDLGALGGTTEINWPE